MPTNTTRDNRTENLIDRLNQILGANERARFAVGYLFLSGLTSMAKRLSWLATADIGVGAGGRV